MISLSHYLILSAILFCIGLAGIFINRRNILILLLCLELVLLAVNTNFVAFSHYFGNSIGQIFVFFILTVAAAEVVVGLAILMLLFRSREHQGSIEVDVTSRLKG